MCVFKLEEYSQLMRKLTGNNTYMPFVACCYLKEQAIGILCNPKESGAS